MAANVGTGSVAGLQSVIDQARTALTSNDPQALTSAVNAATTALGGGATGAPAAAAAGTGTPTAGAQADTGGIVAGGGAPQTIGVLPTQSGKSVTVVSTDGKYTITPATGAQEVVNISGKQVRFDGTGKQTTAFDQVLNQRYHVDLDRTSGISNGLANLSKIFGASQQQVRDMSDALAEDASVSGTFDPVDLQRLSMAQTTSQQMTAIEKSIYDSMKESIQAWLQR